MSIRRAPLPPVMMITDEGAASKYGVATDVAIARAVAESDDNTLLLQLRYKDCDINQSVSAMQHLLGRLATTLDKIPLFVINLHDPALLTLPSFHDFIRHPAFLGFHLPATIFDTFVARHDAEQEFGICQEAWRSGIFGVSCHSPQELRRAQEAGATYGILSPIFETPSKPGYGPPLGCALLANTGRTIRNDLSSGNTMKIYALGGITAQNISCVAETKCDGVAIMGGGYRGEVGVLQRLFTAQK